MGLYKKNMIVHATVVTKHGNDKSTLIKGGAL